MARVNLQDYLKQVSDRLDDMRDKAILAGKRGGAGPLLNGELLSLAQAGLQLLREENNATAAQVPKIVRSKEADQLV